VQNIDVKRLLLVLALNLGVLQTLAIDSLDRWERLFEPMALQHIAYGNGIFLGVGDTQTSSSRSLYSSKDGKTWTRQNFGDRFGRELAFGNGTFVAIAWDHGWDAVLTSTNGVQWTTSYPISTIGYRAFSRINFVRDRFIIQRGFPSPNDTEGGGENLISTDGKSWDPLPSNLLLDQVAYGNGDYAATARDGSILHSTNLTQWSVTIPSADSIWANSRPPSSVAFGNETFIAATSAGLFRSTNAIDWSASPSVGPPYATPTVRFVHDRFVTFFSAFSAPVMSSPDGLGWSPVDTRIVGPLVCDATDGTNILLAGDGVVSPTSGTNSILLNPSKVKPLSVEEVPDGTLILCEAYPRFVTLFSTNNLDWARNEFLWNDRIVYVAHVGNTLFALSGFQNNFYLSTDGKNWETRTNQSPYFLRAIAAGPTGYTALATARDSHNNAAGFILSSPDTFQWTEQVQTPQPFPTLLQYENGNVVAAGNPEGFVPESLVYTWVRGSQWFTNSYYREEGFRSLTFGNNMFLGIAGYQNQIWTSPDGNVWQNVSQPALRFDGGMIGLQSVAFGSNHFVAVGSRTINGAATNLILSARNSTRNWLQRQPPTGTLITGVKFAHGRFYLLDDESVFQSSILSPFPRLDITLENNATLKLTFEVDPGSRVQIQSSPGLNDWKTELTTNAIAQTAVTLPITGQQRFFRLQLE
jgi:hypothetical protein